MTDATLSYQVFRWVKYATYALLSLNIWFFLAEEIASARFAIETGEDVAMGIQLFSATLATLALTKIRRHSKSKVFFEL